MPKGEIDRLFRNLETAQRLLIGMLLILGFVLFLLHQQASEIRLLRTKTGHLQTARKVAEERLETLEAYHDPEAPR